MCSTVLMFDEADWATVMRISQQIIVLTGDDVADQLRFPFHVACRIVPWSMDGDNVARINRGALHVRRFPTLGRNMKLHGRFIGRLAIKSFRIGIDRLGTFNAECMAQLDAVAPDRAEVGLAGLVVETDMAVWDRRGSRRWRQGPVHRFDQRDKLTHRRRHFAYLAPMNYR